MQQKTAVMSTTPQIPQAPHNDAASPVNGDSQLWHLTGITAHSSFMLQPTSTSNTTYLLISGVKLSLGSSQMVINLAQCWHSFISVREAKQLLLYDLQLGEEGLGVG